MNIFFVDDSKIVNLNQTVEVSEDASFRCFGRNVVWYFNNSNLPPNVETHDGLLIIHNVNIHNDGYYKCKAEHFFKEKINFYSRGYLNVYGIFLF